MIDFLEAEVPIMAKLSSIVSIQSPLIARVGVAYTNIAPAGVGVITYNSGGLGVNAISEVWTLTCTFDDPSSPSLWSVTGSISGAQAGLGAGTPYDNLFIKLNIADGAVKWNIGDKIFVVTQGFGGGVYGSTDIKRIYQEDQKTPAAYVVFGGNKINETRSTSPASAGVVEEIDWLWWVIIAVADSSDLQNMQKARKIAGPLIMKVMQALRGWVPVDNQYKPMKQVNGDIPSYTDDGFAYFPLKFSVRSAA